jgi:hypothetical protein
MSVIEVNQEEDNQPSHSKLHDNLILISNHRPGGESILERLHKKEIKDG